MSDLSKKVIITCAVTGGIHTPTMSGALPFTQAALLGGSVRVGLEDSLHIGRGRLASSNAEQVRKIRTILTELGHEIAAPAEARRMLGFKGGGMVGF